MTNNIGLILDPKSFDNLKKDVKVIGTEIASDAENRFPNTIEWDFHNVKDEWLNNVDFIYSNSFDQQIVPLQEFVRAVDFPLNL